MRKKWSPALFLIACFFLFGCAPGVTTLTATNDYFSLYNKDRDYSHGTVLSHETKNGKLEVGQRIYTPADKQIAEPLPNERPYAGYAYVSQTNYQRLSLGTSAIYGAELGLVGPDAHAKESQCTIHKALGQECPRGWANQLHDEPGVVLRGGLENVAIQDLLIAPGVIRSHTTAEVGNVSTQLDFGTRVEYHATPNFTIYAGPEGHLVARDIFLDGNTFRDSQSVDKKWFFSEMVGGVATKIGALHLGFEWRAFSSMYEGQQTYNYGSVSIGWEH